MYRSLHLLYATNSGDSLTAEQCADINKELAELAPTEVPPEQIDNVTSYLERQFLFQQVDPAIHDKLERLSNKLQALS